jgi:hypothetical protein
LLLKEEVLCLGVGQAKFEVMIPSLDGSLLSFESFHFLTLAFTGRLSRTTVAENSFYSPLLLLVLCFRSFSISG